MTDRQQNHTRTYVAGAEAKKTAGGSPLANLRSFFEVVEKSSLVDAQTLNDARRRFAGQEEGPAEPAAQYLQELGILTRWQCRQLLESKTGFFLGRYKLCERIGVGGMGAVFKAEHQLMKRVVALKVIRRNLLRDPHTLTRFLREVKAVASLVHPNIVTAYDADCVGDTYFLVMECIEGRDLDWRVRTHGPLPLRWACDFCRQAALGLQHAHERGLVHRDIKPKNLLAVREHPDKPHTVKILDFGLARLASESHESPDAADKAVIGSFGFMAPEQVLTPAKADIRGDIFSLGCTLYFLLTGVSPFAGKSDEESLEKLLQGEPAPLRNLLPTAPPALERIVAKMLAHDPQQRFQTPQEVAQALASFSAITLQSFAGANSPVPIVALSPPLPHLPQAPSPQDHETGPDAALNEFSDRLTNQPQAIDNSGIHALLAADLEAIGGPVHAETKPGWSVHTARGLPARRAFSSWPFAAAIAGGLLMLAMLYGLWKLEHARSDPSVQPTGNSGPTAPVLSPEPPRSP